MQEIPEQTDYVTSR